MDLNESFTLKMSHSLWKALEAKQRVSGQPLTHIIRAALTNYLQVEHATLFQVSTSTALVEGIYESAVNIQELRKHGDFGLGTFEGPYYGHPCKFRVRSARGPDAYQVAIFSH